MSNTDENKLNRLALKERELLALRHTAEHVLHTAMQNLYPSLKKAMGPATDDGFYFDFDFDLDHKISEADFTKIEKEMQNLIDENLPLVQEYISAEEARDIFKNNPYKLEWVDSIQRRGEEVSIYKMGKADLDLCRGPHVKSTGEIKAFKLLSVAGAYWHGDEKNKMLTRIYGTAFPSQEELDNYLKTIEEAEKRDHRKIGKELDLFVFSDLVGKGLPLLTPKGATIRRVLQRFIEDEEIKRGYHHVVTPPLANLNLYRISGHYPYYQDTMYPPMHVDEEELMLRPMTCPHHFMLYKSQPRSYRELPLRIAEIAYQFRYEKSGELSGLLRVREFTLADAHIIASKDQARMVIEEVLDLIDYINSIFGLNKGIDYRYRLSLGDRKDEKKYFKDDEAWDYAENVLRSVLQKKNSPFFEGHGEAAFYGPKIDVQLKNVHGKEETAFTVQYDFVMPKRFGLVFTDNDRREKEPIVIHRSSIGSLERTIAFLIEHFAGALPAWISPVQIKIITVSDKYLDYARKINDELSSRGLRTEIDERNETLGAKIRDAQIQKIPYMIIIGNKEQESGKVSLRLRDGSDLGQLEIIDLINKVCAVINAKSIKLWH